MLPGRRTADGALFVTQGPPPAGTPLVGGIAVSPAGVIYASQSVVPVFSPLDLFASGEQGAWYDPSDLSTMFQDRAGTTPVTADGQTVGKILDKSGRGNHAVALSDAARPLYKTSGGLHWMQFDGVDDSLSTAAINFTSTDKMSVFGGVRKNSAFDSILVELGPTTLSTAGSFYVGSDLFASTTWDATLRGSSSTPGAYVTGYTTPVTSILSVLFDIAQTTIDDEIKWRIDGVAKIATTSGATSGTGNFSNNALNIAMRESGILAFNCRIYSLIVLGRLATTQEITDTETWVNTKTGAY